MTEHLRAIGESLNGMQHTGRFSLSAEFCRDRKQIYIHDIDREDVLRAMCAACDREPTFHSSEGTRWFRGTIGGTPVALFFAQELFANRELVQVTNTVETIVNDTAAIDGFLASLK